jgi:hypothetical protein
MEVLQTADGNATNDGCIFLPTMRRVATSRNHDFLDFCCYKHGFCQGNKKLLL